MKTPFKVLLVAAVVIAVITTLALKKSKPSSGEATMVAAKSGAASSTDSLSNVTGRLPRLVDLGAGKCIPCKKMAPILEELKKEYAGRMNVEFVDVWQNPDAAKPYNIEIIPTQIFYDAEGKELFRHVGFFGKEEILAKWKEFGVDLAGK
jgi:thioredoxin 1